MVAVAKIQAENHWFAHNHGLFCVVLPPGIDLILSDCYKASLAAW
jgi:hypothetical protein